MSSFKLPDIGLRAEPGADIPRPLMEKDIQSAWLPSLQRIEDAVSRGKVTLVVNDATRPPSGPMLKPLERILAGRVRILFATGTHRDVTSHERDRLLCGSFSKDEWTSSSCDSEEMVSLGNTSAGTGLKLHPWLFHCSAVVSVNSVEPHYFAGYTGGRKSFLPGAASRETIVANHYLACLPGAEPGKLEGNPVNIDMMEALDMLEERVEIVQGNGVIHDGELISLHTGGSRESFLKAAEVSREITELSIKEKYGLVVLHPGSPLDISLYQSEKALYNCRTLVRDGGTVLLVAACGEGLGSDNLREVYMKSMDPSWNVPDPEEYRLGDHAIVRLRKMRGRMRIALASSLPDRLVRSMGMEPVRSIQKWIQDHGHDPVLIPRAGFVVPRITEE